MKAADVRHNLRHSSLRLCGKLHQQISLHNHSGCFANTYWLVPSYFITMVRWDGREDKNYIIKLFNKSKRRTAQLDSAHKITDVQLYIHCV